MNMTPEKELENLIALQKIGEERILLLTEQIEKQKNTPLNWENCFQEQGFYINNTSEIIGIDVKENRNVNNKNVFRAEKEAKSALAMAQLSHIIWVANGCEELNWSDAFTSKYVISRVSNRIDMDFFDNSYRFLAFKTSVIRDKVYEENKQLIHDYLMISL